MGWVKTEKTNKLSKLGDIDFTTTAPVDGNALVYDETNDVWVPGESGGGNANEMVLTQDEYDALTPEEQLNGTNYYINDASVGAQSAAGTPYDNSLSDLLATDVQDAIDELVMGKVDAVNGKGLSTEDYTTAEKTKLSGIPNVPTPTTNDIDKVIKVESNGQGGAQYTLDDDEKNQCGAFVDYTDLIATVTFTNGSASYTATTDCYAIIRGYYVDNTKAIQIKVDGVLERGSSRVGSAIEPTTFMATSVLLKNGQTLTVENCLSTTNDNYIKVYGLQYSSPNLQPVIYSEDEREIGVWTNGKPLYEKTIITNSSVTNADVNVDISNLNVELIIYISGEYSRKVNNLELYYPWGENEYNTVDEIVFGSYCRFYKTNDSITYKITHKDDSTTDYQRFTIRYTKTTDAAGSGTWTPQGVPAVHYSTDEQVVGTWIDGKTVYEKTFQSTTPSAVNTISIIEDISSLDVDVPILLTGNVGNVPINWRLDASNEVICFVNSAKTGIAMQIANSLLIATDCYLTLRYTKSST